MRLPSLLGSGGSRLRATGGWYPWCCNTSDTEEAPDFRRIVGENDSAGALRNHH